jgi:putative hydrolase of the HAD superfamily
VSTKGLVIFDGDDTLWSVEQLYDAALDQAQALVAAAGLPGDDWRTWQRVLDLERVLTMGLSPDRFPGSSVAALHKVAEREGVTLPDALIREVELASRSVFSAPAPVIPGANEVLAQLSGHFWLALVTKGDVTVQDQRIAASGLAHWFDRIMIVTEHKDEAFARLPPELGVLPSDAWSVGNSLASDINPAVKLGLRAIWVDAHVWEHERRETVPDGRVIEVGDLKEVGDLLVAEREGRTPSRP